MRFIDDAVTGMLACRMGQHSPDRDRGRRWRRIRAAVLRAEPLCRACMSAGTITEAREVDHIDGDYANCRADNLQPLCRECHVDKTTRERGHVAASRPGVDGMPTASGHHWGGRSKSL